MACVLTATVYFRGADGLMLVFDVTSEESFENTRNWVRDINKHVEKASVQKILVGNKADLATGAVAATVRLPVPTTPLPNDWITSVADGRAAFAPACNTGGSGGK